MSISKNSVPLDFQNDSGLDRSEAALLEHLSHRFSKKNKASVLSFPEPLESNYRQFWIEQSAESFKVYCIAALSLMVVFGVADFWLQRSAFAALWDVRLPVVVILGIVSAGAFMPGLRRFKMAAIFIVQLTLCVAGYSFFSLSAGDAKLYCYATALSLPLFTLIMSGCLFRYALVISAVSLLVSNVYLSFLPEAEGFSVLAHSLFFVASAGLGLLVIYQLEKAQRSAYLQIQQSNLSKFNTKELDESRGRLQFLVALDSITGIANRKSFDRALKSEWGRAARSNAPLSLLLIDVDDFTEFNAENGRSIANDVLQKVAAELKRFARRQGDIAARFDQDCFAVLLADTEGVNAGMVAKSIAENVAALKEDDSWANVTVCIGVGSISPNPKTFPADLIGSSICALKAAKKRGLGKIYNLADSDAASE